MIEILDDCKGKPNSITAAVKLPDLWVRVEAYGVDENEAKRELCTRLVSIRLAAESLIREIEESL